MSKKIPEAQSTKVNIVKWDIMLSFCTAKVILNKVKRQLTEWENMFSSDLSSLGLILGSIRSSKILNNETNDPVKKWAKDRNSFQKQKYKWPTDT